MTSSRNTADSQGFRPVTLLKISILFWGKRAPYNRRALVLLCMAHCHISRSFIICSRLSLFTGILLALSLVACNPTAHTKQAESPPAAPSPQATSNQETSRNASKSPNHTSATVVSVGDGDTLTVSQNGGNITVRMACIICYPPRPGIHHTAARTISQRNRCKCPSGGH